VIVHYRPAFNIFQVMLACTISREEIDDFIEALVAGWGLRRKNWAVPPEEATPKERNGWRGGLCEGLGLLGKPRELN
jgi:hypothetical protein